MDGKHGNKNGFQKISVFTDYDVDILNLNNQKNIFNYFEMHSLSLFPTFTRPSRMLSHSATLIDNMYQCNRKQDSKWVIN